MEITRGSQSVAESCTLQQMRLEAARTGKWNIGYFAAGAVFWAFAALVGMMWNVDQARIYWLVATFFIFPVAVAVSRLVDADPFLKNNPIGELVGYTHMSVIALSFPVVIVSFLYFPQALPLTMAIAYCIDFYVMSWAFDTPLFGVHAAVRTVAVSVMWFVVPTWRYSALPATVALFYVATVLLIPPLRQSWLKKAELASC